MLHHFLRVLLCCCFAFTVNAQQVTWPEEIPLPGGSKIVVYQPQPEKLEGNRLSLRAAVSYRQTAKSDPIFGVIWAVALLETDKSDRSATVETINVTRIKVPDITDEAKLKEVSAIFETEVPKWNLVMSLDQLLTSIKAEQQVKDDNLNNNPPEVIYRTKPAMLVVLDGEPFIQMDNNLKMERVLNSPNLIIKNPTDNRYYLYGGSFWYSSSSITSGYQVVSKLPDNLKPVDQQMKEQEKKDNGEEIKITNPTPMEVIVRTKPAELIQTDGEATFKNIQGTSLLFADNSLEDIFKDINDQKTYILLAGRWYSAPSLEGKWTYVPSDKLPADFAKIPEGSDKDGVLTSVAGTPEAEEAVAEAQIPQTARVDRSATTSVTYDGAPKFSAVENTSISFAENSNLSVVKSGDKYYAIDNGVWYISNSPGGPWAVSTERPAGIENVPPTSPVYNTKYVYIYDVTPQHVFTGYTPGYLNSFVLGPTVVWGTGWPYSPWHGHMFFPRPMTWGFGFAYNPWMGWSMGFGWNSFFFHPFGFYGGWFGPRMFRPPFRPWGWNGGFYGSRPRPVGRPNVRPNQPGNQYRPNRRPPGSSNNIYRDRDNIQSQNRPNRGQGNRPARPGYDQGNTLPNRPGGNSPSNRPNRGDNNNYPGNTTQPNRPGGNSGSQGTRPGTPGGNYDNLPSRDRQNARPARGQNNNVMSDRDGNIYRNNQGNWQQRQNNNWQPAGSQQQQNMNRTQQQRDRGGMRDQNYNRPQQRPSGGGARPAGGGGRPARGGGRY